MQAHQLWHKIKTEANRLGFDPMGIASALPIPHIDIFLDWIHAGHHAGMEYLARENTLAKRLNPNLILEGCQRIICLALLYNPPQTAGQSTIQGKGRVSAYARTRDYHQIIWKKLAEVEAFIHEVAGKDVRTKSYVDTGPILERSYAALAGIGGIGKHTCLIVPGKGSYFFLAEILTDLELPLDPPFTRDLCGSCTRCIDACPTSCILPNRTIDAGRCLSYLTIENKGIIPDALKPLMGSWVFGCDICQMVCPHNRANSSSTNTLGDPLLPEYIDLLELLSLDETAFTEQFGQTPLSRAKQNGMLRNAAVALGNQRCQEALPALETLLEHSEDYAVQDACDWAIDQIRQTHA